MSISISINNSVIDYKSLRVKLTHETVEILQFQNGIEKTIYHDKLGHFLSFVQKVVNTSDELISDHKEQVEQKRPPSALKMWPLQRRFK